MVFLLSEKKNYIFDFEEKKNMNNFHLSTPIICGKSSQKSD